MHSADRHKVCFPIAGRPAINREIDVYKACGIEQFIVVVGAMANQVMETIASEHEGVIFAYQAEQLGTGHAARQGARLLEALGADEDVLLVSGDRIIEPTALERLNDLYYVQRCDMAFMVKPRGPRSDHGRVLLNPDGSVLANVEVHDIWQRRALARLRRLATEGTPPSREDALNILCKDMDERHAEVAFGSLWRALQEELTEPTREQWAMWIPEASTHFDFVDSEGNHVTLSPEQVNETPVVNTAVYLLKSSALRYALARLNTDNAQREEYLSDVINVLAQSGGAEGGYRVCALRVDNPNHVLAFNNPAQLLEIEDCFQKKSQRQAAPELPISPGFRSIADWIAAMQCSCASPQADAALGETQDSDLYRELYAVYGDHAELLAERKRAYLRLLDYARGILGPESPVLLTRAPGRANILGRHIDHQGGNCNLIAIDREIVMAVRPRDDDKLCLYNVSEGSFEPRQFSIGEMLTSLPWDDWMSLIDSQQVRDMVSDAAGDWSQYVRAAVLRLQKKFTSVKLRGMDLIVLGNIPIAAGLSSSSALVVASAEATVAVNDLDVFPSQFVDLCGEGEWFVGTRGGSADHAAMKLGQKGKVAQVTFFDFGLEKMVDFPTDYRMVICNSQIQARKAAGARDVFNHRIACYRLGVSMVKARYRQYAPLIHHLRDVNVRNLGIPLSWIYRILLSLPEHVSREELETSSFQKNWLLNPKEMEAILTTHAPVEEDYPIRGVVLFGLAESERSRVGADLLANGQVAEFGRMMNVSHNGDRVVCHDADGNAYPYDYQVSNAYLLDLMMALESGDPKRVLPAQLEWQPGAYRCSTPEIDLMVDVATQVPGVMGAQLAGAGLGGCMMVLAHRDATGELAKCMEAAYYAPRGLTPDVSVTTPIAGSGVLLNPRHVRSW